MEVVLPEASRQIIEISDQKKYSLFSNLLALLFVLLIPLTIGFSIGFLIGKYQAVNTNSSVLIKSQKTATSEKGKTLYSDGEAGFKISYPESWQTIKKESGVPGVILKTESASVEIWLSVLQPVTLSAEQKAGVEKTNIKDIIINKQKLKMTEYLYKAGNYFSTVELPAKANNPQVTFWIKALDKDSYEQALGVVNSFSY